MIIDFIVKLVWNGLLALVIGVFSTMLGNFIPRRYIFYDKFPFKAYGFEKSGRFYHILRIEKWKTKLPDISEYIKSVFPKRVYVDLLKKDDEYFKHFAKETCISELVHFALILISPIYIVFNWDLRWGIAVMIIDIVVNIPFIMVQRYNRPRLVRIAMRNVRIHEIHAADVLNAEEVQRV